MSPPTLAERAMFQAEATYRACLSPKDVGPLDSDDLYTIRIIAESYARFAKAERRLALEECAKMVKKMSHTPHPMKEIMALEILESLCDLISKGD